MMIRKTSDAKQKADEIRADLEAENGEQEEDEGRSMEFSEERVSKMAESRALDFFHGF